VSTERPTLIVSVKFDFKIRVSDEENIGMPQERSSKNNPQFQQAKFVLASQSPLCSSRAFQNVDWDSGTGVSINSSSAGFWKELINIFFNKIRLVIFVDKMVYEDIEGVANLYRISAFMNRDLLKANIDFAKMEDHKIANEPSQYSVAPPESFCEAALEIISSFESGIPSSPPVQNESAKATETILPPQPKLTKKPIIESSDYEKQKLNRLLFGAKPEEDNSERLTMIESINSLREELTRMDIKTGTIPQVDDNSTMFDIKNVYKMLLHKKNISVHYETAKDFILVGITQLVNYCDGRETTWGHRPNLTGWDKTARLRLNSLKSELAQLASNFFQSYDIGPLAQILLSLIPSAIMHASTRSTQSNISASNDTALQSLHEMM